MATTLMSPLYLDLVPYFATNANSINLPFDNVTKAFKTPVAINVTKASGVDWTAAYPGTGLGGFATQLTVALDVPVPETLAQNATTALSSLTFSLPGRLWDTAKKAPKPMDPSWYVCRHTFITTAATAREKVAAGQGCGFLPNDCAKDLEVSMTKYWVEAAGDDKSGYMCSGYTMDIIPESCRGTVGIIRQDVAGFDASVLKDERQWRALLSNEQSQYSWRMGTGYLHPYDTRAGEAAANRTYIVGTVYGYSKGNAPA